MSTNEFAQVAESLIRQIAQAIDGYWWHDAISQDDVHHFNQLAKTLFNFENDILEFFTLPRTQTHSRVDPGLSLPDCDGDRRTVGFNFREPFSGEICSCAISIWERAEPDGSFELVDADDHSQQVAIDMVIKWLDFVDTTQSG